MLEKSVSRRTVMMFSLTLGALAVAGCSGAESGDNSAGLVDTGAQASADPAQMVVYRDPNCGCCEAWAGQARQAGFKVTVVNDSDMPAVKRRFGVPEGLGSCHTTVVAGYAFEGHVPLADVQRLLRERPVDVKGLAVPGMPAGSPGMEVPDGTKQPFEVIAFGSGRPIVYSKSA